MRIRDKAGVGIEARPIIQNVMQTEEKPQPQLECRTEDGGHTLVAEIQSSVCRVSVPAAATWTRHLLAPQNAVGALLVAFTLGLLVGFFLRRRLKAA